MTTIIYWFRNDLRIVDNPTFEQASKSATQLIPIYIHPIDRDALTPWGFLRIGHHRKVFLQESLKNLKTQLRALGSDLLEFNGSLEEIFPILREQVGAYQIYCEQIEAPEEITQIAFLEDLGFEVKQFWQSSMLDPNTLPFDLKEMPDVFTQFRQLVEEARLTHAKPIETPKLIPGLPSIIGDMLSFSVNTEAENNDTQCNFKGGEYQALSHLNQYLDRRLPDTYKQTRNQLNGMDCSSKFSPWLAFGCLSARVIVDRLKKYESLYGANDGTYWLWFELLWRDYFRFLHFKYGKNLYFSKGLSKKDVNVFNQHAFEKWMSGTTGEELIDAGMRELMRTGYLSNRMRQIVASYWIYDLQGDWRAGAAWFESQLIDYDVYSNQGNWLYIAGRGTDPRGGRAFNVNKQTRDHDPGGLYRRLWLDG